MDYSYQCHTSPINRESSFHWMVISDEQDWIASASVVEGTVGLYHTESKAEPLTWLYGLIPYQNVWFVEELFVKREFRSLGLGKTLMCSILTNARIQGVTMIALQPEPFDYAFGTRGERLSQLIDFYESFGFQRLANTHFWAIDFQEKRSVCA